MSDVRLRVVLVSTVAEAVAAIAAGLRAAGHDPVAVVTRPRVGHYEIGDAAAAVLPDAEPARPGVDGPAAAVGARHRAAQD